MKVTTAWGAVAALACFVLACGDDDGGEPDGSFGDGSVPIDMRRDYTPEPFEPTDATRAYCPAGDVEAIEARITEILGELTVREKVALMHGEAVALVDGVWRVEGNERVGLPGLGMLDGPRGLSRFSGKNGTAFPVGMLRGATWDPALEERVGAAMAREVRSAGADVLLAPTINVLRHPRWGRAQETYSEDTHHLGAMGVGFIRGVQLEGVLASAKHYAANSIEDTRHEVDVQVDERTLREVYLPHFRRAVQDAQVASVMSAYNSINGDWADRSTHLLRDILKGEWSFQGFVESDWILGTHGASESVAAGLDIEMPAANQFRRLPREVEEGVLDERLLDDSVRRIARAQLCYGLDERERVDEPSARETPEHLTLAREVARRGLVLLRNERVGPSAVLPLDPAGTYVLTGPLAEVENIGDEGSSSVQPSEVVTAFEGLGARADITLVTDPMAEAATLAAADAVIVMVGLVAADEGEATIGAGDRASLALPAEQVALVQQLAGMHDRVVVVLEGGAPVLVEDFVEAIEGLLWAGYPGSEGGHAIAEVLFGDYPPTGRLPFSWPRSEADLPPFDNESATVTYEYLHGYRHLQANATEPRFPFGFGLDYTSYSFDALRLATGTLDPGASPVGGTVEVEVDVTNTGASAGRVTVQVYVSAIGSRVERAPVDLRAFAQLELGPGETGTASMAIPARDLAFYDALAGAWELEAIEYRVSAGPSSAVRPLEATFTVP